MPKKKDMKEALINSIKKEGKTLQDRFKKANKFFDVNKAASSPEKSGSSKENNRIIKDGFSMSVKDNSLIHKIKTKCLKAGMAATKSEIVRGGIHTLAILPTDSLCKIMESVEKIKVEKQARQ